MPKIDKKNFSSKYDNLYTNREPMSNLVDFQKNSKNCIFQFDRYTRVHKTKFFFFQEKSIISGSKNIL
jgi:hypothetical protein